ncbi:group II intron reverse transcriptase/maturase [Actinomadura sp. DC4]|uniref:group II intron reverse transcriptase/maturase n=1 Tax=Actinomadura sp. DC4 TaxID=3055069 RepID=UPI0025B18038|nr:group II intron reverse transcriptase/maturase [Actinomadura sp. DC4]MDN3355877.1 group II intron reverse transcriptase/maturase [Actinomadura sp. DC4]
MRSRTFQPLPVRARLIPKPGSSKKRRLGIPVIADRVVQASLKLVVEPIFEADFQPCSFGFRPNRRAHDAIAEIHHMGSHRYTWVLEADIEACFDTISHTALMDRVRRRVGDKRVLALVKAFCKAGILTELGQQQETTAGTPQGGILSPLLSNIALSVLDEWFMDHHQRSMATVRQRDARKQKGLANWRLIRYADDWVAMVNGTKADAERLRREAAEVLAPMGLRLSETKTLVTHIDDGFVFLGHHIQRRRKRGTKTWTVYTYPSKKALNSIIAKVRGVIHPGQPDLRILLIRLNAIIRGWCNYFRHGSSKRTFSYLGHYVWHRLWWWLRKRHGGLAWRKMRTRLMNGGWEFTADGITLQEAAAIPVTRYRWRAWDIPTPWSRRTTEPSPTA